MMTPTDVRCVLAMLASDKHNKGLRTVAQILRDAGVEVIYLGEYNTPEAVARVVVAEDARLLGISTFSGNYVARMGQMMDALRAVDAGDVPVMVGGLVHEDDEAALRDLGVAAVFGARTRTQDILDFVAGVAAAEVG